jgi:hypothetical protein
METICSNITAHAESPGKQRQPHEGSKREIQILPKPALSVGRISLLFGMQWPNRQQPVSFPR